MGIINVTFTNAPTLTAWRVDLADTAELPTILSAVAAVGYSVDITVQPGPDGTPVYQMQFSRADEPRVITFVGEWLTWDGKQLRKYGDDEFRATFTLVGS